MSIELPEAYILATQMDRELKGKQIATIELKNYRNLQKLGCINRNLADYDRLIGGKIESVISRGLLILVKIGGARNLLLAPEYGGRIHYHPKDSAFPNKFHLKLGFSDASALTVALTGLGGIQALGDDELCRSYVYKRDFSAVPSPLSEKEFVFERFADGLAAKNANIKSAIVGKEALVVGLSNSAFQDIIFRAKIHPKRKASSLQDKEKIAIYQAMKGLVADRIGAGGKNLFFDLYGKQGAYVPLMGPNLKSQTCTVCGVPVDVVSLGGGQVFFCPNCQT